MWRGTNLLHDITAKGNYLRTVTLQQHDAQDTKHPTNHAWGMW
jgi:hypothetical protein